MSIPKDHFLFDIGDDVIDLASLDKRAWDSISSNAKYLIKTKQVTEVSKAYIAAFLVYASEVQALNMVNPQTDPIN